MSLELTRVPLPIRWERGNRAAALQRALIEARTPLVAWIDPALALPESLLATLTAAFAAEDVAVATVAGGGRRLNTLGVPSGDRGARPLYALDGLALFHRDRVLSA